MNAYTISNNTRGNEIAAQGELSRIAIGLISVTGLSAVLESVSSTLSSDIMGLGVRVQREAKAKADADTSVNEAAFRTDLLNHETAAIRAIFKEKATQEWTKQAMKLELVKDKKGVDGVKLDKLGSIMARAMATLDGYTGTIEKAWKNGLLIAVDIVDDQEVPETRGNLTKRTKAAIAEKADFASVALATCRTITAFAEHCRSVLVDGGKDANEDLCENLQNLMPLLSIAVTQANDGSEDAQLFFMGIIEAAKAATLREIKGELGEGVTQEDVTNAGLETAATLPEEVEETEEEAEAA